MMMVMIVKIKSEVIHTHNTLTKMMTPKSQLLQNLEEFMPEITTMKKVEKTSKKKSKADFNQFSSLKL
jgi:hypothetical protein